MKRARFAASWGQAVLASLTAAVLCTPTPFCCGQNEQPSPTATLQVQAQEVVLDVIVKDHSGNLVDGLSKDDFSIFEDGERQRIRSLQQPSSHRSALGTEHVRSSADLSKAAGAPVDILVLDELNTPFADMSFARDEMVAWLKRQPLILGAPTLLLVANDRTLSVLHDYTQERAALLDSLQKHLPSYPVTLSKGGSSGPDAARRMALSLGSLMQIAESTSGIVGRKNIIWMGAGFPAVVLDDLSARDEQQIVSAVARTTSLLLASRITLNIIDPTAMSTAYVDPGDPDYLDFSRLRTTGVSATAPPAGILSFGTFAPATGGTFTSQKNDLEKQLEEIEKTDLSFYTLSYSPANASSDAASFRKIHVVMRDPALVATTRTGYFPDVAGAVSAPPRPPATSQLAFDLTNAALSLIPYRGLSIEAIKTESGYVLHVDRKGLSIRDLANGAGVSEVTVMQAYFGKKNAVLEHRVLELKSDPTSPSSTAVDFSLPPAAVPVGTQRLRIVVRDALSGHIGTVDLDPQDPVTGARHALQ